VRLPDEEAGEVTMKDGAGPIPPTCLHEADESTEEDGATDATQAADRIATTRSP